MKYRGKYTVNIDASLDKVWDILGDIGQIENYSPSAKSTTVVSEKNTGLGATRQCAIAPFGKLNEKIIDWGDHSYKLDIKMSPPGAFCKNQVAFSAKSAKNNTTDVILEVDSETRIPVPGFEKNMKAIIAGLKVYAETDERVDSIKQVDLSLVSKA